MKRFLLLLALLPVLFLAGTADAVDRVPLTIVTADGRSHEFAVEVADNAEARGRGLMFREALADDHGMLFVFPRRQRIAMWMRNTPLPLDMLFIGQDGTVSSIHERAVPYSEETIVSRKRVRYVLEVIGGTVDRLGLAVGDRIDSPAIP